MQCGRAIRFLALGLTGIALLSAAQAPDSFVVGAFFAGLAGGVYAHFKQYIAPQGFGFDKSIEIVVMVILGGMGNNIGVIIAAILLTILTESLRKFGDYRMILYSLLIIILMITRPQGLFTWPLWKRKSA